MGTRSLTVFEDDGKEIVVMYRQFDGYPSGHGQELADFLKSKVLVNGFHPDDRRDIANGMGDLAAQCVMHFKSDKDARIGGIYLYAAGTRDAGEEYIYTVYADFKDVALRVQSGNMAVPLFIPNTPQVQMNVLFDGLARDFKPELCGQEE